jgi:hypothetical protein
MGGGASASESRAREGKANGDMQGLSDVRTRAKLLPRPNPRPQRLVAVIAPRVRLPLLRRRGRGVAVRLAFQAAGVELADQVAQRRDRVVVLVDRDLGSALAQVGAVAVQGGVGEQVGTDAEPVSALVPTLCVGIPARRDPDAPRPVSGAPAVTRAPGSVQRRKAAGLAFPTRNPERGNEEKLARIPPRTLDGRLSCDNK